MSAVLYGIGTLGLRAASQSGVSPWRTTFMANGISACVFLIYLRGWPTPELPVEWLPILGLGLLFFFGNILTVLSLTYGDVSIATPVLAAKVVVVVAMLAIIGDTAVTSTTWIAGALTVVGVALLQIQGRGHPRHHHVLITIALSLVASTCFAVFDIGVQFLSTAHGFHRVAPYAILFAALLSFGLLPFCNMRYRDIPKASKRFVWIGAGLVTLQAAILIYSLGTFQDAAGINIVYGSRGLWGIFFVWTLGKHFGNRELMQNREVFKFRVAGALCIVTAIGLVFA
jgi:drug/metabolite transporter (DMT)-like permease